MNVFRYHEEESKGLELIDKAHPAMVQFGRKSKPHSFVGDFENTLQPVQTSTDQRYEESLQVSNAVRTSQGEDQKIQPKEPMHQNFYSNMISQPVFAKGPLDNEKCSSVGAQSQGLDDEDKTYESKGSDYFNISRDEKRENQNVSSKLNLHDTSSRPSFKKINEQIDDVDDVKVDIPKVRVMKQSNTQQQLSSTIHPKSKFTLTGLKHQESEIRNS